MNRAATELGPFLQRRELLAYEQRMARAAYAYGVDLRRSQWLEESNLGEPFLRSVDRRWNKLAGALAEDTVQPPESSPPDGFMDELVGVAHLLRAPLPAVRLLRPSTTRAGEWPLLTPLGTTRGAVQWLVVDDEVMAVPHPQRAFLLAAALAHLQCDHGPLFSAHLIAHRRGLALGFVRTMFAPWSRVAIFSADRAGLLAAGSLESAVEAIRLTEARPLRWMPRFPPQAVRERALEDFDRSAVVARIRQAQTNSNEPVYDEAPTEAAAASERSAQAAASAAAAWSLARCDERLTRRLGLL